MKRFVSCIAFLGLVVLTGCSGDSPAPPALPTVAPDAWGVVLVADSPQLAGYVVELVATVTMNGSPAPDGTLVIFQYSEDGGATFVDLENGRVQTAGGVARSGIGLLVPGALVLRAVVNNTISVPRTVVWEAASESDALEIHEVRPREGSYDGGETVILDGKGIRSPIEVVFDVGGSIFNAEVVSVEESSPLSDPGQVIVRSPYAGGLDRSEGRDATIRVTRDAGSETQTTYNVTSGFTYLAENELQVIPPLFPNEGHFFGHEPVVIYGRGIRSPARVTFIDDESDEFQAVVQNVVESNPLDSQGEIHILTPDLTFKYDVNAPEEIVDIRVEVAIDQPNPLTDELLQVFTFVPEGDVVVGDELWRLEEPSIYLLVPDHGASAGGETVTILGRNFRAELIDRDGFTVLDTAPAVSEVTFGSFEAQILSVSEDGTQLQVLTPRYSVIPLTADELVNVTVTTEFSDAVRNQNLGPFTASRNQAYVFLADEPTPAIAAIAPTAGPVEGGTQVTIFGSGFQFPARVTFGDLDANSVEVFDDQTLADEDRIVCLSPDYSMQGVVTPVTVPVSVTNIITGNESNTANFTYGDNLYITGNSPAEGRPGDLVIIYGSGFVDPIQVDWGSIRLEVVSVSGTELLVKFPDTLEPNCAHETNPFTVILLEQDDEVIGGEFTLLGNDPTVTSVSPVFVQEFNGGDGVMPTEIDIYGINFTDDVIVEIGGYRMDSSFVTVIDDGHIHVTNIPAPNTFGLIFDTNTCLTDTGQRGVQDAPTPVNVTVTNFPGECSNTLEGGIIYEPETTDCILPAILDAPSAIVFEDVEAGMCSAGTNMVLTNVGQGPLEIDSITLSGRFFFNPGSGQTAGPFTLQPFEFLTLTLYFCPDIDNGEEYNGQALILSNASNGTEWTVTLRGTEASLPLIQTAPVGNGSVWTFQTTAAGNCSAVEVLTISNAGDGALTNIFITADAPFAPLNVAVPDIASGGSDTVDFQFCPTVDNGMLQQGDITITSNDQVNSPIVITAQGVEQP